MKYASNIWHRDAEELVNGRNFQIVVDRKQNIEYCTLEEFNIIFSLIQSDGDTEDRRSHGNPEMKRKVPS